jgi:hypothetical protein
MGGVFPARGPTCSLELRNGNADMELVNDYDPVGNVSVQGEDGELPNAPRILALVKPEACTLGGELVHVVTSANLTNGSSYHSYLVYRKKAAAKSAKATQKF